MSGQLDDIVVDCDVCFCRLLGQLAHVNIQPSVGMFSFIICDVWCSYFLFPISDRAELCMSAVNAVM